MLLNEKLLETHKKDIEQIYEHNFDTSFSEVSTHFGIVDNSQLQAIGSLGRCSGEWYLCCGYVKPEHRGKGLHKKLLQERITYMEDISHSLRAAVHPNNAPSIHNVLLEGFDFEGYGKVKTTDELVEVYKKSW